MKLQIIKCKTCGEVFAACKDGRQSAKWYTDCAKYMNTGNAIIEVIETNESPFSGNELNKCCGKKVKLAS